MKNVLIAVQARSTSTRLRDKSSMAVGELSIVGRVMYQAVRLSGAHWLSEKANVTVAMLVPYGDKLKDTFRSRYNVFEGPEDDVLTRFHMAAEHYNSDIIVRLTGDCAWMQRRVIAKVLGDAMRAEADYCSNVLVRTFMEGLDVEVMSRTLLAYINNYADTAADREHVTTYITDMIRRDKKIPGCKVHTVLAEYDFSDVKTSVDTLEEYQDCVRRFESMKAKKAEANSYGEISN